MTRSIFDPDSGETERSGSAFSGPDADQVSQMPPDVTDGDVEAEELADHGETPEENVAGGTDDEVADVEGLEQPPHPGARQDPKRSPEL